MSVFSHDASLHRTSAHINLGQSLGQRPLKMAVGDLFFSRYASRTQHTTAASDNYVAVYAHGSDSVIGPLGTIRARIDLAQWSCKLLRQSLLLDWKTWYGKHVRLGREACAKPFTRRRIN